MLKVICVGYRDWALSIYKRLMDSENCLFLSMTPSNYNEDVMYDFKPDFVLFYGWSKIIRGNILNDFNCLMLHPSKLPLYRGGSPIQNQILDGVTDSAVTIFKMDNKIDNGPIYYQKPLSLTGSLDSIFNDIENIGYELTIKIFNGDYSLTAQPHDDATYCKRRKPTESEITIDELTTQNSEYLYNKIRMLADPYPNAFIKTKDGKKILIKEVVLGD